jgi:hypothetical protein
MALVNPEHWARGFVWADAAETELAVVTSTTGASWQSGFLRDPDGRLVGSASDGEYVLGFERIAATGALSIAGNQSPPRLFTFESLGGGGGFTALQAATVLNSATPVLVAEGTSP